MIACVSIVVMGGQSPVGAQERNLVHTAESNYFSIYAPNGFDIAEFLYRLDYDYSTRPEDLEYGQADDLQRALAKTIDALYLEVSDIMDIHVYSYHGDLKILRDRTEVGSVFYSIYRTTMPERGFYLPERKALYISSEDVTLGMLGHEMGHAVIGAYFVVPPPAKVQEVLCGYVEYNLRKKRGTLPPKTIGP